MVTNKSVVIVQDTLNCWIDGLGNIKFQKPLDYSAPIFMLAAYYYIGDNLLDKFFVSWIVFVFTHFNDYFLNNVISIEILSYLDYWLIFIYFFQNFIT